MQYVGSAANPIPADERSSGYDHPTQDLERLVAAFEAAHDAIWITDCDNRIIMINAALERLIGKPRHEIIGTCCRETLRIHTTDGRSTCRDVCPVLAATPTDDAVEACLSTPTDVTVWVEIKYAYIRDAHDQLEGIVHIARDLTDRKALERLKDEFIELVSHELRTPLHHIKGFVSSLLQPDVTWDYATQRDFLQSIDRETERLTALIAKILSFSRLEAGYLTLNRRTCDVGDLVDVALQRCRGLLSRHQVAVHLPAAATVQVDEAEIELVLINLIENAVKYSPANTDLTIVVEQHSHATIFKVIDQGYGIPAEQRERIFERFYRIDRPTRRIPGTGLGLAICQRIIDAHGGRIWVESGDGRGSCFCFSIPHRHRAQC